MAFAIKIKNLGWGTPTAKDCRPPTSLPENNQAHLKAPCGLTGVTVPMFDEHWTDVGGFEAVATSTI
eukprot:gene45611-48165_t